MIDDVIEIKLVTCSCCGKTEEKVLAPILLDFLAKGGTLVYLCKICSFPNARRPWRFRFIMWILRRLPWSMEDDWGPEYESPENKRKAKNVPAHTRVR